MAAFFIDAVTVAVIPIVTATMPLVMATAATIHITFDGVAREAASNGTTNHADGATVGDRTADQTTAYSAQNASGRVSTPTTRIGISGVCVFAFGISLYGEAVW